MAKDLPVGQQQRGDRTHYRADGIEAHGKVDLYVRNIKRCSRVQKEANNGQRDYAFVDCFRKTGYNV